MIRFVSRIFRCIKMPPGTHRRTQAVLNHDLARCPVATAVAIAQTVIICFVAFDDRPIGT